jgi:capsular polysaccharide biosynthesis protein
MSQQALDFRTSVKAVRRHSKIVIAFVVLGLLIGAAYAVVRPPMLSSTALVVLPQAASSASAEAAAASGTTDSEIATQVVVAGSDPVLAAALPHVIPSMSLQTLETRVQAQSVAGSIISITAKGATAADAEATANAVADSYIAYVTSANSPVGQVQAKVLESANSATGSTLISQIALYGLLGLLGGAVVGVIVALAMSTNDRRLVERDAIANSIGAPVLVSLPVSRPPDAASWVKLLEEYEPGAVHSWGLTKLLQQLGVGKVKGDADGSMGNGASLTVLSLASDPSALALGPQVAAFAAAQGIPTALVMGPQQDANVTATLRTAFAAAAQSRAGWRRPLHLVVAEDDDQFSAAMNDHADWLGAPFVVVVAVVDGRVPLMPSAVSTTATVLGVSSGTATAEQLARAATAAATQGREVTGILVADPDPADQSTGRIPRLVPPLRRQLPTRADFVPTEIKR